MTTKSLDSMADRFDRSIEVFETVGDAPSGSVVDSNFERVGIKLNLMGLPRHEGRTLVCL
jgi:hypothetical protein